MANTLKFGNGEWYGKKDTILAYNDENSNFKPLPFNFERASSATVVNKEGLIETVGAGMPRIDYKDDSEGALKLEPSRTNLLTYSEDFSQWSIISSGIVITDNTNEVLSPSGKNDATKVEFNVASKILGQSPTLSGNYSGFVYVKGTQGETIRFNFGGTEENFTLTGGWDKLERTNITATANAFNLNTFGDATARTIYVWGAQLEQGSYATSYIPTSGSAATRLADECNGSGNDQVINSTEGVLYAEISALANDGNNRSIALINNNSNRISFRYDNSANRIEFYCIATTQQYGYSHTLSDIKEVLKVAFLYSNNNFQVWINGIKVDFQNSGSTPVGLSSLDFNLDSGTNKFYGNIKDVKLYNTALTDQELKSLTQV
jgi:hypothetical protein